MHNIYITGNTFRYKEQIKQLKPVNKNFKPNWRFQKHIKAWSLPVADKYMTKEYLDTLQSFCANNDLEIEILKEIPKPKPKPLQEYDNPDEFFDGFHKRNGQRYY